MEYIKGVGYSDHLPIIAKFTNVTAQDKTEAPNVTSIKDLYKVKKINELISLKMRYRYI
ncbi:MAG: hypothetical protein ACNI3H_04190 [Halarcobacter ebronensis]